jgi:hypothetical protein
MPGGGARPRAGRKKIDPLDPITLCCGAEWEKTINYDPILRATQLKRQITKQGQEAILGSKELREIRLKLARQPLDKRKAYVEAANIAEEEPSKPANLINDAGHVIKKSLQRVWPSHKLSNADLAYVYAKVQLAVWERFTIELSSRRIRARVKVYQKYLANNDL